MTTHILFVPRSRSCNLLPEYSMMNTDVTQRLQYLMGRHIVSLATAINPIATASMDLAGLPEATSGSLMSDVRVEKAA